MCCRSNSVCHLFLILVQLLFSSLPFSSSQASDDFLEYDMFEELPAGTCVIQLTDSIELRHKYAATDLRSLRFSFLTQPNLDRQYFTIDQGTGEIRNAFRVDREQICPRRDDCVLKFDVVIQPIKYFQIIKVKVEIKDINDNAPSFPERLISHQISEFAELGTAFVVPAATDPDANRFGIDRYALLPIDGKFELSTRDTADGGTDLRLILRERLDREVEDHHLVTVLAIDGGDPPKTGSISVNISVQDANDNSPEFENTSYEIFVSENTAVGTVITKVRATDRDIGLNAAIVYEFSKHTAQEYGHLFGIKSESGKIYLKNNLDYETGSIYLLSVTANDRGPDNLPAHASVIVRVEDINDHRPHISVNTLTTNSHAEVRENSEIGMFVAHLSVVDEDSGENGKFLCAVDDRNFLLQPIYSSELKLVTASRLDREQRDSYDLSISCKDYGLQPQSSVVPLKVKVIDENDHTPQFQKDYYETQIAENNEVGVTLFQVEATDADLGPNGEVKFKADVDLERFIEVDSHTGIIRSASSFDYEQMKELVFYLTATDTGSPPRASTAKMKVIVLDTDDHRPTFVSQRFNFNVLENELPWTEVGTVVAFDNDSSPYNAFTYSLETTLPADVIELFELNSSNGKLITRDGLDRERKSLYHLTVYAITSGAESVSFRSAYTASAIVTVRVDDLNDNSPIFTYPSAGNETISISSLAPKGHCVVRLRAVDFDAGSNANLTYQLLSSNRPTLFWIVASTGDVLVASDLSRITMETVVLRLVVRDGGQPQLSDHTQLSIVVSREIPFVTEDLPLSILASEDMVVVLSFTLAIILLAIAIIITIICIFRRRSRRYDRAGGRSGVGPGEAGHGNGLAKAPYAASDKKPVLNCSLQTSSNGKLQCSDGGGGKGDAGFDQQNSAGNGKTSAVVNAFAVTDAFQQHSKTLNDVEGDSRKTTDHINDKKIPQQQNPHLMRDDVDHHPLQPGSQPRHSSSVQFPSTASTTWVLDLTPPATGTVKGMIALPPSTQPLVPLPAAAAAAAQSSSSFAPSSSSFSSSYHPMLFDELEPSTCVPVDSIYTTTPKHRATMNCAWKDQPYQQTSEQKKPVVVFIRDQNEMERDAEDSGLFGSHERIQSKDEEEEEPLYPVDRRSLHKGPDEVDCYHTLPLPPSTHHLHQRRPTVGSGQEMTSTGRDRTRCHGFMCDSRLLHSGSRSGTLSTSNLRDILDCPIVLTGGGFGGGGGGSGGEGCCGGVGMRRDGYSIDGSTAMLGGGGLVGASSSFGSEMQLLIQARAKQQQQQLGCVGGARVHFSSPVAGYKGGFKKDLNRFHVFNNNNPMTTTPPQGVTCSPVEQFQLRSTQDNR